MKTKKTPQAKAAKQLWQWHQQQASLSGVEFDSPLCQEMIYGVVRWWTHLDAILKPCMHKPMKPSKVVYWLLLVGVYQLRFMKTPDPVVVNECVQATTELKQPGLKNAVNAILRAVCRQTEFDFPSLEAESAHPAWFIKMIKQAYPDDWENILAVNNQYPPMVLRINPAKVSRDAYLKKLQAMDIEATPTPLSDVGLQLNKSRPLQGLPDDVVSQGEASQCVVPALQIPNEDGIRVLDACCAPGGKLRHMLALAPKADLLGLDVSAKRVEAMPAIKAKVLVADAAEPDTWHDGRLFHRILIDAPCSGSGVIRRHPDIKWRRRESDIPALVAEQHALLNILWPLLEKDGICVYSTCSILPEENQQVIDAFLQENPDATLETLELSGARLNQFGTQLLPAENGVDGFFIAVLRKAALSSRT